MTATTRLLRTGVGFGLGAAAVNAAVWALARAGDVSFAYVQDGTAGHVGLAAVVGMSIATFGSGLLVAAVATRLGHPFRRVLQVVAAVMVVGSLVGLPGLDASTSTRLCLAVTHAVVGAAYVLALQLSVRDRAASARFGTRNQAVAA
jgi:hypothetical protein